MQSRTKDLLTSLSTIILIGALALGGYVLFAQKEGIQAVLGGDKDSAAIAETVSAGADVAKTVAEISQLKTAVEDTNALLSSPAFANLTDFSVTVSGEPTGRANPFTATTWKLQALARQNAHAKK